MKNNKNINQRGSFTVEAALLLPIVFAVLIILMYICVIMYNRTQLSAVGHDVSERASMMLSSPNIEVDTGEMITNDNLYSRLFATNTQSKINDVKAYFNKRKLDIGFLDPQSDVEIGYVNYLFYRKIKIKIQDHYDLPLKGLIQLLHFPGTYNDEVDVNLIVNDPVEVTRNVDFVSYAFDELGHRFTVVQKTKSSYDAIINKLNELADKWKQLTGGGGK
ncbi:pilus assembly protein [Clostridium sp. 19966]|uniref:TadE/TadG family type IV pilus assembly protein n=1 Tax=Clostridium sp. 19966 TaxID=2768166 RepID=UPI0028DD6561|nr:pilus assembly protein [Clostridium sp. 19966]MDT8718571.1 pilus assembly protein [Clostridium sp. 19966]